MTCPSAIAWAVRELYRISSAVRNEIAVVQPRVRLEDRLAGGQVGAHRSRAGNLRLSRRLRGRGRQRQRGDGGEDQDKGIRAESHQPRSKGGARRPSKLRTGPAASDFLFLPFAGGGSLSSCRRLWRGNPAPSIRLRCVRRPSCAPKSGSLGRRARPGDHPNRGEGKPLNGWKRSGGSPRPGGRGRPVRNAAWLRWSRPSIRRWRSTRRWPSRFISSW